MSFPTSERITFTLSNLKKTKQHVEAQDIENQHHTSSFRVMDDQSQYPHTAQSRRRPVCASQDTRGRSIAAAAGVASSLESRGNVADDDDNDASDDVGCHDHVDARKFVHPPKLKSKKCCCATFVILWTAIATLFSVSVVANSHGVKLSVFQPEDTGIERRLVRDESIRDYVQFGIWDSHVSVTPLQLQVAVSMALGVRASDDDVHVKADEDSFFEVRVEHATLEEAEYVASQSFLVKLNIQLIPYGGNGVLSRPPKLHKNSSHI